jgi:hypothetical protein
LWVCFEFRARNADRARGETRRALVRLAYVDEHCTCLLPLQGFLRGNR